MNGPKPVRPRVLLAICALATACPANAQLTDDARLRTALRCFEENALASPAELAALCPRGVSDLGDFLSEPHPLAGDALDGLVEIALDAESPQVAQRAVELLKGAGTLVRDSIPLQVGVVDRLEAIFFGTSHPAVRLSCISLAESQADRRGTIEFLTRVATETDAPDGAWDFPASYRAIDSLWRMGERQVIEDLLRAGSIPLGAGRLRAQELLGSG